MTGYYRFIGILLLTLLTLTLSLLILLYRYDPLRLFSRTPDEPVRVVTDFRQQAMSYIRYADYESVILGTSMFENSSADQATELFGEKFVNLSLSGSTYYVRSFPLRKLLQDRPIKTIIYSVDFFNDADYGDLPVDYLYDDNRLNDFAIYLNKKYLRCLLEWSDSDECRGVKTTLDKPRNWMQHSFYMARFGGADKWQQNRNHLQIQQALENWQAGIKAVEQGKPTIIAPRKVAHYTQQITQQLDECLVDYVQKYPNTRFIAVFPPYFIELYAQWQQSYPSRMQRYLDTVHYLVEQSEKHPNLEVYAFANNDYTNDIANYKDEAHYHPDINRYMMSEIAAGTHRISTRNVNAFSKILQTRAADFNLKEAYKPFVEP